MARTTSDPVIPEDEMEEIIASKDWPPYYMESLNCRKEKHGKCTVVRQPTNHIDPHPTICTCECHDDERPELAEVRRLQTGVAVEDEFVFGDDDEDEILEDDFDFDDDDDDELVFDDDEDEDDELIFDDEDDDDEYVFD